MILYFQVGKEQRLVATVSDIGEVDNSYANLILSCNYPFFPIAKRRLNLAVSPRTGQEGIDLFRYDQSYIPHTVNISTISTKMIPAISERIRRFGMDFDTNSPLADFDFLLVAPGRAYKISSSGYVVETNEFAVIAGPNLRPLWDLTPESEDIDQRIRKFMNAVAAQNRFIASAYIILNPATNKLEWQNDSQEVSR